MEHDTQTTITISRTLAEELERASKRSGKDRESFLRDLIERLAGEKVIRTKKWGEALAIQSKIKKHAAAGGIVEFIRRIRETRYGR